MLASGATIGGLLPSWEGEALLRMTACVVIGGLIGLEREYRARPAGIRTHILVCLGCGLAMLISTHFARLYGDSGPESVIRVDPARMAYGVLAGIGFLGAGVIMRASGSILGLTTAASLWCVAALGLGIGLGMYLIAGAGTVLTLASLWGLRRLECRVGGHASTTIRVTQSDQHETERLRAAIQGMGARILRTSVDHRRNEGRMIVTYQVRLFCEKDVATILQAVRGTDDYERIEID